MNESARAAVVMPSPNRSDPPEFQQLNWKTFEELTCSLLEKEPGVRTVDLFNTEGQSQYGIDVLVHLSGTLAIDVASCKCYKSVPAAKIREWANDFLDHYDTFWKSRQVRAFLLVVSAPVNTDRVFEEIEAQRLRFAELNIRFEVWHPRTLQEKLRPHPGIVGQYLDSSFIGRICGEVPVSAEALAPLATALLSQVASQTAPLLSALSESWDGRLELLKCRLREEPPHVVVLELERIRVQAFWPQLTPNVRSKCLRYLASAKLQADDISGAETLAYEADSILPAEAPVFRALLLAWKGDPEGAMQLVGHSTQRDAQEMEVALLLEAGLLDEAETLLNGLSILEDAHAIEAARLRSYLQLFRGDREGALAEISNAEKKAPRWFAIRRAGAVIRYACALSSAVGSECYAHPTPVAPELIREDDTSQRRLKEALATFNDLAKERARPTRVSDMDVWAFACACNLVDGSVDAQKRCSDLLHVDPGNPEVLGWALGRGFDFDRERSLSTLEAVVANETRDASHVLALTWLLSSGGNGRRAETLLRENEALFQGKGRRLAYEARLQSLSADFGTADGPSAGLPFSEQRLLDAVADESDAFSWDTLESAFAQLAIEKASAPILLGAATRLAAGGRWEFLQAHIESILAFGTASAIEVAIHTAYNSGNTRLAMSLIQQHREAFPRGELPRNVRQIEVYLLAQQGDHPTALRAADSLVQAFGGARERLLSADLRIDLGDISGALPLIRAELSSDSLKPRDALRLSRVVAVEDEELAQKLWKAARRLGIPDQLVIAAHVQARRLGLEEDASTFEPTIQMLAQKPGSGAIAVSREEVEAHRAALIHNQSNFWEGYLNGVAPFHVASEFSGIPFAAHYFINAIPSLGDIIHQPLLIRNGARGERFDIGIPLAEWRLHCDVSSLLLAFQLDVLELIEASVAAILVPKSLSRQLVTFEERLQHPQPSRLRIAIEIDDLVQAGRLKLLAKLPPRGKGNVLADVSAELWSVTTPGEQAHPSVDTGRQVSLGVILDGMRCLGHLDDESYERARAHPDFAPSDRPAPPLGSTVIFQDDTLGTLANFCSLQTLLRTYKIYIDSAFAKHCTLEHANSAYLRQASATVARLRRHVAAQLSSGRYQTVQPADGAEDIELDPHRAALWGISELLTQAADEKSVVMCDDRHMTGYPAMGMAPLVGIYEVLLALRESKNLSDAAFFAAMVQMRQAHAMYLPMTTAEVLHHLELSHISGGAVMETQALASIRRYVARVAASESHLKIGDFPEPIKKQPDELAVLLANRRLCIECITEVWTSRRYGPDECAAMSTWIWSNLRVERPLGEHPNLNASVDTQELMTALTYCSLVTISVQLVSGPSSAWREAFTAWLENVALSNRLSSDQRLRQSIDTHLVNLIENLFRSDSHRRPRPYSDAAVASYLRKLIDGLPDSVQKHLLESKEILELTGTKRINVVYIGPVQVLREDFVTGVRKALRFGKSKRKAHEGTGNATFTSDAKTGVIHVRHEGKSVQIFDDLFPLLALDEPTEIRNFVSRQKRAFDCSSAERERLTRIVEAGVSPEERFERLQQIREESLLSLYASVEERLKEKNSLPLQQFEAPHPSKLYTHLHLSTDETISFPERLDTAAASIVSELGIEEAFLRFGSLPTPLPAFLVAKFCEADDGESASLRAFVTRLAMRSPLHFIHSLALKHCFAATGDMQGDSVAGGKVLQSWPNFADALGAILAWTEIRESQVDKWHDSTIEQQLLTVWYHSTRMLTILNEGPATATRIIEFFKGARTAVCPDAALGGVTRAKDCASPTNFVGVLLLFCGLAYAARSNGPSTQPLTEGQWQEALELMRVSEVTNPWLFSNRLSASNRLNTFLASAVTALPASLAKIEEEGQAFELEILQSIDTDNTRPMPWVHLYALARLGLRPASLPLATQVMSAVRLINLANLTGQQLAAWRSVAGCMHRLADEQTRTAFRGQFIELANFLAERHRLEETPIGFDGLDDRSRELAELVEAAVLFCRRDDMAEAYAGLADILWNIAVVWPTARQAIRRLLEHVYDEARLAESASLWAAIVNLRALC
jgi:hypothetical protein